MKEERACGRVHSSTDEVCVGWDDNAVLGSKNRSHLEVICRAGEQTSVVVAVLALAGPAVVRTEERVVDGVGAMAEDDNERSEPVGGADVFEAS